MRFNLEGVPFRLKFQHAHFERPCVAEVGGVERLLRGSTRAVVQRDGDGQWRDVACGEALCAWADLFDRERGRKLALRRALDGWPREKRGVVWGAYWGRRG